MYANLFSLSFAFSFIDLRQELCKQTDISRDTQILVHNWEAIQNTPNTLQELDVFNATSKDNPLLLLSSDMKCDVEKKLQPIRTIDYSVFSLAEFKISIQYYIWVTIEFFSTKTRYCTFCKLGCIFYSCVYILRHLVIKSLIYWLAQESPNLYSFLSDKLNACEFVWDL